MSSAIYICDPKYPQNLGGALRACHIFGANELAWSGDRVKARRPVAKSSRRESVDFRLPREERMRRYGDIAWGRDPEALDRLIAGGYTPVCVEVLDSSWPLTTYVHPDRAVYVFGPEDGDVPKGVRHICHDFVTIPGKGCLNLAAAVNVILYDRLVKEA